MANTSTLASALADEVADLLGHDNMDRRILDWLSMAFNDMIVRVPCPLFFETADDIAITATTGHVDLGAAVEPRIGSPVFCVFKDASGIIYTPPYRTPNDFDRIEKEQQGSAPDTGTFPLFWTLGPVFSASLNGRRALRFYPRLTANHTAWLWYTGQHEDDELTGTEYFKLPYHWESVIIWGAAAEGAKLFRPQLAPLFSAEYEEGIARLMLLMNARPDAIPVLQSVVGPYGGSPVLRGGPRFPDTING